MMSWQYETDFAYFYYYYFTPFIDRAVASCWEEAGVG